MGAIVLAIAMVCQAGGQGSATATQDAQKKCAAELLDCVNRSKLRGGAEGGPRELAQCLKDKNAY